MPEEVKSLEDMTDEEFDKFSEDKSSFGDEDTSKESEKETEEVKETKEKSKETEDKPEETEDKVEEEEDKSKDEESEEEEESEDEEKPKQRNYNVPLKKLTKQKQKYEDMLAERDKEIEELKTKPVEKPEQKLEANDAMKKFAEEKGLDIGVVEGLVGLAKGDEKKLDVDTQKLIDDMKSKQIVLEEESQFNKYYDDNIVKIVLDIAPEADGKKLLEVKQLVKKLSYSDKYIKYEIEDVVNLNKTEINKILEVTKGRKSVETNRAGNSNHDKVVDYNKLSGEDIMAMSDEEFDKYSEEMGSKSKSDLKITHKGVEI